MTTTFIKPIVFTSAFALGMLNFVACGDDNDSNFQAPNSSSSFVPPDIPIETPLTPIVFDGTKVSVSRNEKVSFTGSVKLDFSDTTIVADPNAVHFTNLILYAESASKASSGAIKTNLSADGSIPESYFTAAPITTINFDQIGLYADLTDGFTECGDFNLIITAVAADGTRESVTRDTIPFVRNEINCQEPESSSSSVVIPGAPLVSATASLNTKINKCFNFTTAAGDDVSGDICFSSTKNNNSVYYTLSSKSGLQFAYYSNANDSDRNNDWTSDWLPPAPTTDDFQYKTTALKETISNVLNETDLFIVCIAPTYVPNSGSANGFYTFVVSEFSTADANGDATISFTYFKSAQ